MGLSSLHPAGTGLTLNNNTMASTTIDKEIRERINTFLGELSQLVREAALEAVQDALGGANRPSNSSRRASTTNAPAAHSVSTARKAARRKGKRLRRSSSDLEQMGQRILDHVKSNPGCRMEEISAALGERTYDLRRPLEMLKDEKKFKTTGQKRATQYYLRGTAAAKSKKS